MKKQLVLASGSPRRRELLAQLGYDFTIIISDIEESRFEGEPPKQYVQRLAEDKAKAVYQQLSHEYSSQYIVIGADTIVTQGDQVFEKPKDFQDSQNILGQLSGKQHQVMTAVSVISAQDIQTIISITDVWFKSLSQKEIEDYWLTNEPCDKAGSYGIQGVGGKFVTRIEGSYHAVVGLPLFETDQLLRQFF